MDMHITFGDDDINIKIKLTPVNEAIIITAAVLELDVPYPNGGATLYLDANLKLFNPLEIMSVAELSDTLVIKGDPFGIPVKFKPISIEDHCGIGGLGGSYKVRYKAFLE